MCFLIITIISLLFTSSVFAKSYLGFSKSNSEGEVHEIQIKNCVLPVVENGKVFVSIPDQDKNTPKKLRVKVIPKRLNAKVLAGMYPVSKKAIIQEEGGLRQDMKTLEGVGRVDRADIMIVDGVITKIIIIDMFQ